MPFVGSKCLVVSNEGGLGSTNVHSRVGRLDLHGAPRTPYTTLSGTHAAGAQTLTFEEDVTWEADEPLVLMNPLEEATVAAKIGPRTVTLVDPLRFEHFSGWYNEPSGGRTDLRSRVMTKRRNVKIQGDAKSEGQLYGCRTGAFFGGIYRVENVEFSYSWHTMG